MRRTVPFFRPTIFHAKTGRPVSHHVHAVTGWEPVVCLPVRTVQPLRVTQDNAFFLPCFQRKHSHLKRTAIDPLQQRRVFHFVNDLFERVSSVFAFGHTTFHQLAVDIHSQT